MIGASGDLKSKSRLTTEIAEYAEEHFLGFS